ncbi:MAG: system killer suppression protein [Gammaproteobacteria bacterium]|nr:system killer suppression protein [Gammaproteobacteria bacterium]
MEIAFRTKKLRKILNSQAALRKSYGDKLARSLMIRLAVLRNAETLSLVPASRPERRHLLKGKRRGQFAVDLDRSFRLIFEPNHDPVPQSEDGGIDLERVTAITVIEVADYH